MSVQALRREIARRGCDILLRRPAPPGIEVTVKGKVHAFGTPELIGGLRQSDRKIVFVAADLAAAGFPGAPEANDRVEIGGDEATVTACEIRHDGAGPARYDVLVKGSL